MAGDVEMHHLSRRHAAHASKPGTVADASDMARMGKVQELNRLYSVLTLVGYAVIVGLTWPFALITGTLSLTNGGAAGAIWVFVGVMIGMFLTVLSMAEMASIEPTAGGQYHWVSVFAPQKWRKPASYIVGWMCALGWQSYVPGASNVCASVLQAFAVVANESYVPKAWHLVLLTILICTFAIFFNTLIARRLPGLEALVFMLYMLTFFAFLIVLASMGERSSAKEVFTHFEDNAGWGSIGTACFVGVSGPVITLIGSDSAVHMAEELKDASRQLPKAMLWTAGINYVLGFAMLITFLFVLGDVDQLLKTPTGAPWVQVVLNSTNSRKATLVMVFLVVFFFIFCAVNQNTTSSRQLYAFSRDGGLPCGNWISYVNPSINIPVNAVILTWLIGCGLALIPLGSTAAFLNIQTIGNSGLIVSYIICISCRLHNRNFGSVYGNLTEPPKFYLGKTGGNIINIFAVLFLFVFLVSGMFPVGPKPTTELMNWSSLALASTVIVAMISYIFLERDYLNPERFAAESENSDIANEDSKAKGF